MGLMDLFKKKSSGDVAKDRLKLLLVSDRANCSPEMMEMIKRDIIQVISKYMDIDADALEKNNIAADFPEICGKYRDYLKKAGQHQLEYYKTRKFKNK